MHSLSEQDGNEPASPGPAAKDRNRVDVDRLLAGPLGEWLEQQAEVRAGAKKQAGNRLFLSLLVMLPLIAASLVLMDRIGNLPLWGSGILLTIALAWSQSPKHRARKAVKIGINQAIAGALGLAYSIDFEADGSFASALAHRLLPGHDRASFGDHWSGSVGGSAFDLYEAKLEERRSSGKRQRWVTVFRGVVIAIGCRRRFHGTTLVARDGRFRSLFFGRRDAVELEGRTLQHVTLTHPDFEDAFDIWSTDPVEAQYLVHPVYVERLIALEESFRGDDIRALFVEGRIIVVINAPDLFESGSIDASEDRGLVERTVSQFGRMTDLAETLNEPAR